MAASATKYGQVLLTQTCLNHEKDVWFRNLYASNVVSRGARTSAGNTSTSLTGNQMFANSTLFSTPASAITFITPTAPDLVQQFPDVLVGDVATVARIQNLSPNFIITLGAGLRVSLQGLPNIPPNSICLVQVEFTNITPGSEAVNFYVLNPVTGATPMLNPIVTSTANGTTALTAGQSGSIVYISGSTTASASITLPAPTAGLNFKFVLTAVADGTHTTTISDGNSHLSGNLIGLAAGAVITKVSNATNLISSANAANAVVGDYADVFSDGSKWYVRAISGGTANGWTAT